MSRYPSQRRSLGSRLTAFTLVELLVVIAIIALLISILIPSVQQARLRAKTASLEGTLHAIEISLEQFQMDFKRYPSSSQAVKMERDGPQGYPDPPDNTPPTAPSRDKDNDYGAHLLAQVLFGWDLLGYVDPKDRGKGSSTNWYNINPDDRQPYRPRKPLYMDPSQVKVGERPGEPPNVTNKNRVIFDDFENNKAILYYRANPRGTYIAEEKDDKSEGKGIFNLEDNYELTKGDFDDDNDLTQLEEFSNALFDESTVTKEDLTKKKKPFDEVVTARPFNRDRFVLWSAGPDGDYGTSDDVTNFEKK